ncbi:hypothetical protein FA15DRAFT_666094 [Coprinopsis marcescibilis]|uniref:Uncharacterized protein n=1 Tax=Coprinopsis marcescibilis TaxID=230819 RepID=A0A5C3L500_COPMA|nr:hypothetical protein FA15DRAFT_666094 [Coprinopsis marcescibilis]
MKPIADQQPGISCELIDLERYVVGEKQMLVCSEWSCCFLMLLPIAAVAVTFAEMTRAPQEGRGVPAKEASS